MFNTIEDIKRVNKELGHEWFSPETLEFFHSRVSSTLYHGVDGRTFFLTSEKMDKDSDRRYTIREAHPNGRIATVGNFQQYATVGQAKGAVKRLADEGRYKWIVYLYDGVPGAIGGDLHRVYSLAGARDMFEGYSQYSWVTSEASASLYPYSDEAWEDAVDYNPGCPFDYPSKIMTLTENGGVKVENA